MAMVVSYELLRSRRILVVVATVSCEVVRTREMRGEHHCGCVLRVIEVVRVASLSLPPLHLAGW